MGFAQLQSVPAPDTFLGNHPRAEANMASIFACIIVNRHHQRSPEYNGLSFC